MRLAHVTDLHFGSEEAAVVAGLRADLIEQNPDRVLVGGDLTMRARDDQFRAARELLDSAGRPWTCVPGNHDLPLDRLARATRPLDAYERLVDAEAQPTVHDGGLRVLGLSTPRPYLWKGGLIDAGQAELIGSALAGAADLKVLLLHHPVFHSPQRPHETLVHGAGRALQAAAEAGVDVVLCGHDHVAAQIDLATVWPGLNRRMIGLMSGTACSRRVRAGESQSYTLLDLAGDRLSIIVRRWRDDAFHSSDVTVWHRSPGGWGP
ncbi:metallophosphoesterase family protein [Actinoplanes solisilvae]|uniref:metallophosphoesterase family protein n=1 Tax=Actinoplanes solisilvae TaxID=2486853 RepID=UPI000FD85F4E|nr:metallophosphoesterase [Actinoplanes solisilvae]